MNDPWEIQQAVLGVARCADRSDINGLVENFSEDAVFEAGGRTATGRNAIFEFLGGGRVAPSTDERTKHVVTNTLLEADGDAVVATSYWQVLRSWGLANWGRYVDRFVRDDDQWRIVHRAAISDGNVHRPQSPSG
jgi:ketosteroid isomerase-like protein